jgi:hypothetical protein
MKGVVARAEVGVHHVIMYGTGYDETIQQLFARKNCRRTVKLMSTKSPPAVSSVNARIYVLSAGQCKRWCFSLFLSLIVAAD